MTVPIVYFAFGSNLYPSQMSERCPDSQVLGAGMLEGFRLEFSGFSRRWGGGVATISEASGHQVQGVLYTLTPADLALLDRFENYPETYDRISVTVTDRNGHAHAAQTYKMHAVDATAPSMTYFHQIWKSYKTFQLNESHLLEAVERALLGPALQPGMGRA